MGSIWKSVVQGRWRREFLRNRKAISGHLSLCKTVEEDFLRLEK